jgi:hypothetical protein
VSSGARISVIYVLGVTMGGGGGIVLAVLMAVTPCSITSRYHIVSQLKIPKPEGNKVVNSLTFSQLLYIPLVHLSGRGQICPLLFLKHKQNWKECTPRYAYTITKVFFEVY